MGERAEQRVSGIAFFDLDHTLLDGDSDSLFIDFLAEHGVITRGLAAEKDSIGEAYMRGEPWQDVYRAYLVRVYEGQRVATMEALATEHASTRVLKMLFPGARALIDQERRRRVGIALLTTTNQLVATPVAIALGIDVVLSTELEIAGPIYTGQLVGDFCSGPGKAVALRRHCRALGIDPAECAMHGDGRSDMEALDAVGDPVAVHPTEELARRASERSWRVLDLGAATLQ